jgi:hypothetical protein
MEFIRTFVNYFWKEIVFIVKPEKIPEHENELIRNIFKLYLDADIIIEDEITIFQRILTVLLTTREMSW